MVERGDLIKRVRRLRGIQSLGNERTADHSTISVESSASKKIGLFFGTFRVELMCSLAE
jgi:hypothetical protein